MNTKWEDEIESFKGIKTTIILEGNINDVYPYYDSNNNSSGFYSLKELIGNIFDNGETKGFYDYLYCDPLLGFTDLLNSNKSVEIVVRCKKQIEEEKKNINGIQSVANVTKEVECAEIIRMALSQADNEADVESGKSIAVILNQASRFICSSNDMLENDKAFFLNLFHSSIHAIRGNRYINTLVLIVDSINNIPSWFYFNNPNVRVVTIPNPDRFAREAYITKYFDGIEINETEKHKLIDLTEGMKLLELDVLRRLYAKSSTTNNAITDTISIYKYGFKDKPWENMRDRLGSNIKECIEKRVMGQSEALDKIVRVIKRSVTGLSGLQHSSYSSKPKGVMFLAGPTGVGKTEVVKTVAEIIFGDETRLIRFDMSEYSAENSDQRLFGAPPGYVGFNEGGQLTNAVKTNPHTILLFDEIEKAHPNIMDKFLQILEDGVMTDGKGNKVYFSETIIFFTSNVGIYNEIYEPGTNKIVARELLVKPNETYDVIQTKVEAAMRNYFKPEVLNRIGENVIVFNYIDKDATISIVNSKIKRINECISKNNGMEIIVTNMVFSELYNRCLDEKVRMNGGRGIGNIIEECYINGLAEFIYDTRGKQGDCIRIDVMGNELVFTKET